MKNLKFIFCVFLLCIITSSSQSAQYLPNQTISIESCMNVLKVLTDQQTNLPQLDDSNTKVHIPHALYPLMIQAKIISYEIHNKNDSYYLLNNGKAFASIFNATKNKCFVIHPDACLNHYGYLWTIVPFVSNISAFAMNLSVEKTHINMSIIGNISHENLSIGSYNLNMQIQTNHQKIVSGQISLQIATSNEAPDETPLHLFDIQSTYLHDVPLTDPPDTRGDTGNFTHIQISGQGERSFSLYWVPTNSPHLIKSGLSFMHIAGTKNLAAGHDLNMKYPDFELTFTSGETIYFNGQYDIMNQSNVSALNVSISPYILIWPKQIYRMNIRFISNP